MHYPTVKQPCSNFRVITVNFSSVGIFRNFTVFASTIFSCCIFSLTQMCQKHFGPAIERKIFNPYFDPILIYISLWIDCLFEICKIAVFPLAFIAGWLQGHWWGFISRNYVVWPTFLLMNVFIALKGSHFWFLFVEWTCPSLSTGWVHWSFKGWQVSFSFFIFDRNSCKQMVKTLIWVCTVCLCPKNGTLG